MWKDIKIVVFGKQKSEKCGVQAVIFDVFIGINRPNPFLFILFFFTFFFVKERSARLD